MCKIILKFCELSSTIFTKSQYFCDKPAGATPKLKDNRQFAPKKRLKAGKLAKTIALKFVVNVFVQAE
jgi:hypothetical protein